MLVNLYFPLANVMKVLDSPDWSDNEKKLVLPKKLKDRLKINLDNLPTPKDDEYITFTETVTES